MAPILLFQILILFVFSSSLGQCFNSNLVQPQPQQQQQQQQQQHADFRIHQTVATRQQPNSASPTSSHPESIYLESMEDLEHVAYLSMRNFNMTDDNLLQSSWLMGLGNTLTHKQHQKPVASMALSSTNDVKDRLALMLESFISHLRNGHLRRLSMEELGAIVEQLRQPTPSTNQQQQEQQQQQQEQNVVGLNSPAREISLAQSQQNQDAGSVSLAVNKSSEFGGKLINEEQANQLESSAENTNEDKTSSSVTDRCQCLVTIYKYELKERQKSAQRITDYESPTISPSIVANGGDQQQQQQQQQQQPISSLQHTPENVISADELPIAIDDNRLMRLCQLAVKCHSAEELVSLISGSWRVTQPPSLLANSANLQGIGETTITPKKKRKKKRHSLLNMNDNSRDINNKQQQDIGEERMRSKSLRDSLSLSLAKLCPLILFQLHDDDGLCTVRRDDRPPMITVWGFATLFVTIVSFCSLIGLSITPLLGSTTTEDISGSEESVLDIHLDSPRNRYSRSNNRFATQSSGNNDNNQAANRACLTLFEGLAVGSLVGSALFSLIPQAFELQERESNQGFLLKAFIIFSGIYLFFCSERIMRIILDTRQQRKKKKRLNHRSSNSIPMPSTTGDFDHHQQQLLLHHHQQQQQLQQHLSGKQNRFNQQQQQQQQLQDSHRALNGRKNPTSAVTFNRHLSSSPDKMSFNQQQQQQQQQQQNARQMLHLRENKRQQSGGNVNQHIKITVPSQQHAGAGIEQAPAARVVNFPLNPHRRLQRQQNVDGEAAAAYNTAAVGVKQRRKRDETIRQQLSGAMRRTISGKGDESETILKRDNSLQSKLPSSTPGKRPTSGGYGKTTTTTTAAATRNSNNGGSTHNRVRRRRRRKTRHQLLSTKQRQLQRNKKVFHQRQQQNLLPLSAILMRNSNNPNQNNNNVNSKSDEETKTKTSHQIDNNHHLQINRRRSSSVSSALSSSSSFDERSSDSESESVTTSNLHKVNYIHAAHLSNSSSLNSSLRKDDFEEGGGGESDDIDDDKEDEDEAEDHYETNNNSDERQHNMWLMKQVIGQQIKQQTRRHNSNQVEYEQYDKFNNSSCPHRQTSFCLEELNESAETYSRQHHHHHHHHHQHHHINETANTKRDISTVAWMIVLGDGLHNFIDGISIGAAFSESILSGVSISVAVICEEFPHELGDFAVLVSSGMTVRQALGYNFVSACTCYFGMAVGIILGDVNDGASYISALAAGVFLYIALVDMMGELSATLEKTSRDSITQTLKLLLLQNVGIFIGISIIFILSFIDF